MAKITIVAENKVGLGIGTIAEHGFCAFLETENSRILWDTGQGFCLPHNAPRMGINIKGIDAIALSHGHYDHTGGMAWALEAAQGATVVCHPACFQKKKVRREIAGNTVDLNIGLSLSRQQIEDRGARIKTVEDYLEIAPGVRFYTGIPMEAGFESIEPGFFVKTDDGDRPDPFDDDACLAIETERGVSVLLGCAHRGMINTLRHVAADMGVKTIRSVWGGTHLIQRDPDQVDATIDALKEMGVETVGAAHCTGFHNEARIAAALPENFALAAVGVSFEL